MFFITVLGLCLVDRIFLSKISLWTPRQIKLNQHVRNPSRDLFVKNDSMTSITASWLLNSWWLMQKNVHLLKTFARWCHRPGWNSTAHWSWGLCESMEQAANITVSPHNQFIHASFWCHRSSPKRRGSQSSRMCGSESAAAQRSSV